MRNAWVKVFYDLRDGDIQWMFQNFMSKKIAARGAKLPFVVLLGIRGMRPYNPNRVIPVQWDTSSFTVDYNGCVKIPFAKTILQEWFGRVKMKGSIGENRYEARYVDDYKTWLQDDLHGVVNPTPCVGREI